MDGPKAVSIRRAEHHVNVNSQRNLAHASLPKSARSPASWLALAVVLAASAVVVVASAITGPQNAPWRAETGAERSGSQVTHRALLSPFTAIRKSLFVAIYRKALTGDADAISAVLGLSAFRARLLGLNAPKKIEHVSITRRHTTSGVHSLSMTGAIVISSAGNPVAKTLPITHRSAVTLSQTSTGG